MRATELFKCSPFSNPSETARIFEPAFRANLSREGGNTNAPSPSSIRRMYVVRRACGGDGTALDARAASFDSDLRERVEPVGPHEGV